MNRIVVALLVLTTGCSWMSSRPVRHYPNGSVDCSTSRGAAGVDTAMAVTTGIVALPAMAEEPAVGLLFAGLAAIYIASASHGYKQAGECRDAIEELAMQEPQEREDLGPPHWIAPSTPDAAATTAATTEAPAATLDVEIDASELEP